MTDPIIAHTATKLSHARGRVVVCGSHGGSFAGLCAVAAGVRAILLNDAGIGLEGAGTAGLVIAENAGLAAATLGHMSCRIGNGDDAFARGIVSATNAQAKALGIAPGMTAREAARRLAAADTPTDTRPATGEEHRHESERNGWRIVVCDSASLIRQGDDDGAIVMTGSHGGLVGDDPATASKADAAFLAYNDAGVGRDGAGLSRLPVLQARGIAAVTVDCATARIGDGASTLDQGIISHANEAATALGATAGTALRALVDTLTAAPPRGPGGPSR